MIAHPLLRGVSHYLSSADLHDSVTLFVHPASALGVIRSQFTSTSANPVAAVVWGAIGTRGIPVADVSDPDQLDMMLQQAMLNQIQWEDAVSTQTGARVTAIYDSINAQVAPSVFSTLDISMVHVDDNQPPTTLADSFAGSLTASSVPIGNPYTFLLYNDLDGTQFVGKFITLENDELEPVFGYVYGTDDKGVRGWYDPLYLFSDIGHNIVSTLHIDSGGATVPNSVLLYYYGTWTPMPCMPAYMVSTITCTCSQYPTSGSVHAYPMLMLWMDEEEPDNKFYGTLHDFDYGRWHSLSWHEDSEEDSEDISIIHECRCKNPGSGGGPSQTKCERGRSCKPTDHCNWTSGGNYDSGDCNADSSLDDDDPSLVDDNPISNWLQNQCGDQNGGMSAGCYCPPPDIATLTLEKGTHFSSDCLGPLCPQKACNAYVGVVNRNGVPTIKWVYDKGGCPKPDWGKALWLWVGDCWVLVEAKCNPLAAPCPPGKITDAIRKMLFKQGLPDRIMAEWPCLPPGSCRGQDSACGQCALQGLCVNGVWNFNLQEGQEIPIIRIPFSPKPKVFLGGAIVTPSFLTNTWTISPNSYYVDVDGNRRPLIIVPPGGVGQNNYPNSGVFFSRFAFSQWSDIGVWFPIFLELTVIARANANVNLQVQVIGRII